MKLSVIILNYNVRYFLEQCVLSVQKALEHIEGEIIVIDNNSSDDSCEMMKNRFPNVKLIENKDNLGFPKGNNIGVKEAKGEYLCILNPDTVVSEDTFTKILKTENWKPNTGIIGCKLIDGTGNFLPESKRGVPTPWVAFTKIFGLYKFLPNLSWFNQYYAQHISQNESGKVDILVGAFMMMKRNLYIEVGGFDEDCFMYSDDIDLNYMVLQKGYYNYYYHETTVIHYKGESTVRDGTYLKRFREAMQFFYKKHFKKSMVFDFMMNVGSFAFALLKKSQQKEVSKKIDSYIVFTKKNLSLELGKPITYLNTFEGFKKQTKVNTEIIFDIDDFSNQEISNFMQLYKNQNLTFKNYVPMSNFMIGSNSSNDKGQIKLL